MSVNGVSILISSCEEPLPQRRMQYSLPDNEQKRYLGPPRGQGLSGSLLGGVQKLRVLHRGKEELGDVAQVMGAAARLGVVLAREE